MVVAGLRFDTSGRAQTGSRWQKAMRSPLGFTVRHPRGSLATPRLGALDDRAAPPPAGPRRGALRRRAAVRRVGDHRRPARRRACARSSRTGFEAMAGIERAVAVFGSARTREGHPTYDLARETGRALGEAGFCVITGGGPGAMEAANRGARDAGARSVGLTIDLPSAEPPNPYLDLESTSTTSSRARSCSCATRARSSCCRAATARSTRLFEALTLIQTGKIRFFPVVLVGPRLLGRPGRLAARAADRRGDDQRARPRAADGDRLDRRGRRDLPRGDRRVGGS